MWKSLFYSIDTFHFSIMQPQTMCMLVVSSMDMQNQGASTPLPLAALMSASVVYLSSLQAKGPFRSGAVHDPPYPTPTLPLACPHTCQPAHCPCLFP